MPLLILNSKKKNSGLSTSWRILALTESMGLHTGNNYFQVTEFEFYSKETKLMGVASSNSIHPKSSSSFEAQKAMNGNTVHNSNNLWSSVAGECLGVWWQVDFSSKVSPNKLIIYRRSVYPKLFPSRFALQYYDDGGWQTLKEFDTIITDPNPKTYMVS